MRLSSIERRYGYGAARICLGHPVETLRLASSRHDKVRGEMRFAFLPGLLCVLASVLLFSTTVLNREDPAPSPDFVTLDPSRIEFALPSEPIEEKIERPAPAKRVRRAPSPIATTAGKPVPTQTPSRAPAPAPTRAPAPQFARLEVPADSTLPGNVAVLANRPSDPRPGDASSASLDADWTARVLSQTATRNVPLEIGRSTAANGPDTGTRPGADSNETNLPREIAGVVGGNSRFMTQTRLPAQGPSGVTANATGDMPHVSAQRGQPEVAQAIRESLATARAGRGTGDWREVPLAALPDCSPAGRQDRLKQAILHATPPSGVCEHADGRFRFVPSRNLGSFLMWTEEWGASKSSFAAAQDACVALEAALRCLTQAGTRP